VRSSINKKKRLPIPVAAQSKSYVCGRSLADIAGSNPARGMDVCLLRVCSQVSASGLALVQRSPNECGASECNRGASTMRRPWSCRDYRPMKKQMC